VISAGFSGNYPMVTPESSLRSPFAEKVLFAGIVANSPNDMYAFGYSC
jgi:hypothetical protein